MSTRSLYLYPGIRYDPAEPLPHDFGGFLNDQGTDMSFIGRTIDSVRVPQVPTDEPSLFEPIFEPVERVSNQYQHFLAPKLASIRVDVVHDIARFTVTHLFENTSFAIGHGIYQFPLPLEAIVRDFQLRIDNERVIRGKVGSKKDSKRIFDKARQEGRVGGLVEQTTAEIFTIELANIPADTLMRSKLSFVCRLKQQHTTDRQTFTLELPTFISPRYGDAPPGIKFANQRCDALSIEASVLTTEDIQDITSDTHKITWERNEKTTEYQTWEDFTEGEHESANCAVNPRAATIRLSAGQTCLDGDLVIDICTAKMTEGEKAQACLETHPTFRGQQALMVTLPEEAFNRENVCLDREIVFVADRSGSMEDKMDRLKSAMVFFIKGIPENLPFNIWCYGTESSSLWPQSKPLTDSTMYEAISYVQDEFKANMGGTEILQAIKGVHRARNRDLKQIDVIVLTDGEVWRPEETINYIKDWRHASEGKARFFALGIGQAVSHELVQGIATAGGGCSEVVTSDRGCLWEDRVVLLLKAAQTAHISSIDVDMQWHGSIEKFSHKQSPADTSALNHFGRNRMYMLLDFENGDDARLEAVLLRVCDVEGATFTLRLEPKRLAARDDTIHLLAVRGLLEDLDRGDGWLQRDGTTSADTIRDEAINLGVKWSMISKWTSMYAVEQTLKSTDPTAEVEAGPLFGRVVREANSVAISSEHQSYFNLVPNDTKPDLSGDVAVQKENGSLATRYSEAVRTAGHQGTKHNRSSPSTTIWPEERCHTGSSKHSSRPPEEKSIGEASLLRWPPRGNATSGSVPFCFDIIDPPFDYAGSQKLLSERHRSFDDFGDSDFNLDFDLDELQFDFPSSLRAPQQQHQDQTVSNLISPPTVTTAPRNHFPSCHYAMQQHQQQNYTHSLTSDKRGSDSLNTMMPTYLAATGPTRRNVHKDGHSSPPPEEKTISEAAAIRRPPRRNHTKWKFSGQWKSKKQPQAADEEVSIPCTQGDIINPPPFPSGGPQPPVIPGSLPSQSSPYGPYDSRTRIPDGHSIIRNILGFQRANGGIAMSSHATLKQVLGVSFMELVTELGTKMHSIDAATTLAVIVLLEQKFPAHRDLWVLMVGKARTYIQAYAKGLESSGGHFPLDKLMEEARLGMKAVELASGKFEAVDDFEECEIAPTTM